MLQLQNPKSALPKNNLTRFRIPMLRMKSTLPERRKTKKKKHINPNVNEA
jgi:hypothetical protein